MQIIIQIKNVYGKDMIYPINETAKQFAALIGTKTLTRCAISQIEKMGYSVQYETQTLAA